MIEADPTLADLRVHYKQMSRGFGATVASHRLIDHNLRIQEERNPLATHGEFVLPRPKRRRR